jgi:hypothetical protein
VTDITFPVWEDIYLKALQEPLDSLNLAQRVKEAQIAILSRLQELEPGPIAKVERQAIAQALRSLMYVTSAVEVDVAKYDRKQNGAADPARQVAESDDTARPH